MHIVYLMCMMCWLYTLESLIFEGSRGINNTVSLEVNGTLTGVNSMEGAGYANPMSAQQKEALRGLTQQLFIKFAEQLGLLSSLSHPAHPVRLPPLHFGFRSSTGFFFVSLLCVCRHY